MGVNTIPDVGISLVTVGKKDLRNQNERTESLWFVGHDFLKEDLVWDKNQCTLRIFCHKHTWNFIS